MRVGSRWQAAGVSRAGRRSGRAGLTLVELLIVVVVLAILAVIALPRFTGAADQSRQTALEATLHSVRTQLQVYRQEHRGQYPDLEHFEQQMTLPSNPWGETVPRRTTGFPLGPYLSEVPRNPYTGGREIADTEVGTSDWYYDEQTGVFEANHAEGFEDY